MKLIIDVVNINDTRRSIILFQRTAKPGISCTFNAPRILYGDFASMTMGTRVEDDDKSNGAMKLSFLPSL